MPCQSASPYSRTAANEDNWFGVPDPKKRKQIQDRLAQRARRRRLVASRTGAAKSSGATEDVEPPAFQFAAEENSGDGVECPATVIVVPEPWNMIMPENDSGASSIALSDSGASSNAFSVPPSSPDSSLASDDSVISNPSNSVFAALFKNGRILGIPCGSQIPWKSRPCGPEIPATLLPTALQMTRLHIPWIDRFPFPRMRDNTILLNGIIDEEDFLNDLFTTDSFTVVAGTVSWDPNGWIIGKEFSKKWGYLFY